MNPGFLFAVQDVAAARAFYEELFGLTVTEDFGLMVGFGCGLVLQQEFDWLTGIPKEQIKRRENNCEICFERPDFDLFLARLAQRRDITLLHDAKEQPWGQRVVRFYDLDDHLIEVGESMKAVAQGFLKQGMTLEQVAQRMDVAVSDVQNMLNAAQ